MQTTCTIGHYHSTYLPYSGFEWLDVCTVEQWMELIREYDAESKISYTIFKVNLAYPESIHDKHIDLPLVPEHYNGKLCTTVLTIKGNIVHVQNLHIT